MATQTNPLQEGRVVCGIMSGPGVSSPFFSFRFLVTAGDLIDPVSGFVHVMRDPSEPKGATIAVKGYLYLVQRLVIVSGEYDGKLFQAHMQIDQNWHGKGGFRFGKTVEENCAVVPEPCILK